MAVQKILSPLPGIFYTKSAPDQPAYKSTGDTVQSGDVVGLVEVMKSFHEVKSQVSGIITAINVENEGAVMAGQELFDVEG